MSANQNPTPGFIDFLSWFESHVENQPIVRSLSPPAPLQCEENANLGECSRYIKLPFSKTNLPANNQTLKSTKESFWISSFLCSTKLTQNGTPPAWDANASRPARSSRER